jgi:hypothetical protein
VPSSNVAAAEKCEIAINLFSFSALPHTDSGTETTLHIIQEGAAVAYETRRDRTYYYLACRVDGRVVKKYLGTGRAAQCAAAGVAQRQAARSAQRRLGVQFEEQLSLLRRDFEAFWMAAERVFRLAAAAANYHRRRGEWRRRRECRTKS